MSVLTKGLAMDFVRQGRKEMAISSVWPAVVSPIIHALSAGRLTTWQSIESAATEATFANNDRLKNDLRKPVGAPL
jgi:L-aminopeptidase/D-esterase-like protein